MKYKLYGLLTVLSTCAMVAVAVLILQKDNKKKDRYLQHKEGPTETYDYEVNNSTFSGHLPVT